MPLSLSKPKPNGAFGYSEMAFTDIQLDTVQLLTNLETDRSYAVLYTELYFPFLDIEFKALAKGSSHVIATNQAANTGSVAEHRLVELTQRSSELESLDCNEPQFLSISMDYTSVYVNVRWLSFDTEDGQVRFHVEETMT
ncbi:MAG: hypothetical protein M1839_002460 [Geoglossum umbratile]|nr:MAG: hypothetical protein M1839_002460 [Geoglossum umbratile]